MRLVIALLTFAAAGAAHADPCEGALPPKGAKFGGEVLYIVDGDGFCVGDSPDANSWIEIRIADFYAPELRAPGGAEAKAAMTQIALGQRAQCVASHRSYDRIVASCTIAGKSIRAWMREKGIAEGGNR